MLNQHPITPPPELFAQCYEEAERNLQVPFSLKFAMSHAIRTAYAAGHAAGADQELEATLGLMATLNIRGVDYVRNARRPKPPSLKEQALEVVTGLEKRWDLQCDLTLLRRALEALDD
jgi:hypothetical protein